MKAMRARRLRDRPPDPVLDPADLGWLAGIIDGEGSISLSHGGSGSPHLRVNITNGSEVILRKLFAILATAGISYYANPERRGTTNVIIGTTGSLLLHRLLRPYLVRQVEQFDAGAEFMTRRYADGRLRVYWSAAERVEWEDMRRRFHTKRSVYA
jgi:LAGLIDADG-like domain